MSNHHRGLRRRSLALSVAGLLGMSVTGMALAAVPMRGGQATHHQFTQLKHATRLNRGAAIQGPVSWSKSMHVVVTLKLRNEHQLNQLIRGKHARLSHAQMAAQYLPTRDQAQAVADFLARAGFTDVKIAPNRLAVSADGSAAVVQSAFRTSLSQVLTEDGRVAYANTSAVHVPKAIADSVQSVLGLQSVYQAHTLARHGRRAGTASTLEPHAGPEFSLIYDARSLPVASDVTVGVWGWGGMKKSAENLAFFTQYYGYPSVPSTVVCTDYAGQAGVVVTTDPTCATVPMGTLEWSMDSQAMVSMTGGVEQLTFYGAHDNFLISLYGALQEIVTPTAGETRPQVVNASFGLCELPAEQSGFADAVDALVKVAAQEYGMTVSVSTGDSGANNCGDTGDPRSSASYPASSPWVVSVSGTTLRTADTTWRRENVWTNSGGSPSSFEESQPWQAPLTYGPYSGMRGPDVAFDANPRTGMKVIDLPYIYVVGGTSLAAPLFAGAWARILQVHPDLGFAAPHLYDLPNSVFHDVRSGNNHGWFARRGWDYVSGLGSLDVDAAAAALP